MVLDQDVLQIKNSFYMTFSLVIGNADQIIQVSDRRITGWDGGIISDAFGKAGHLICDDASVLFSFTGLATIGNFQTSAWLVEAFHAASRKNSLFRELVEHFADLATDIFSSNSEILSVAEKHRRLTVMLSGYTRDGRIVSALISNFQNFVTFENHLIAQKKFTVYSEISKVTADENPTFIQAIGTFHAMAEGDVRELRGLLERRVPMSALRSKVIDIVTKVSDCFRSGGTVGKRLNVGRIDFNAPLSAVASYESDIVESEIHLLDMVDCRCQSSGVMVRDLKLESVSPVVFPLVNRNAPCPCGSGKKYRFCHRKRRWK